MISQPRSSEVLFRRLLFLFREREALRFFPASCAFLSVVSAFAVSHNLNSGPFSAGSKLFQSLSSGCALRYPRSRDLRPDVITAWVVLNRVPYRESVRCSGKD